ncbi:hypothetical protein NDU88_001931 [Pleurodeles waltl]|uniref:Uncharacterized protein n=1 Tax=Pleurodeles waltl TaxID=8319 RepID=A0AAV7Q4J2_PLEWA|nr:hypothetical protein NDU88_001931 [Pleurodeles waltl]
MQGEGSDSQFPSQRSPQMPYVRLAVRTSKSGAEPPPQGETVPAASRRGRVCCGRAHSRPTGPVTTRSSWGVQGAGPDPLMKQIRPWPVVVVPQGLLWRGRRVSLLVSSRGGTSTWSPCSPRR